MPDGADQQAAQAEGEPSVNRILAARGTVRSAPDLADDIKELTDRMVERVETTGGED